jgi:ATP-binding cassette, subfamily B, bacterial
MGGPSGMLGADRSQLGDAKFDRNVVRRVLRFARPYRWMLVGYLAVIVAIALIQLVPPLIFRQIIDEAIPRGINEGDRGLLHLLAAVAVAAAVGSAAMAIVERWLSARIGEGVIYDLRVAVFGHVQRMPISFFTRTQTGALTNRLNSDVIGAQRALTTTIGGVASNVITLVTTLIAMALLEWRLTLLSLVVLPLFIVPARRVGRRLQAVTRTQMDLNASMNTTMTERFNVSGALLVKLFGRTEDEERSFAERADGVRRTGIRAALYGRTFFIALGLVGAIGTAAVYWVGGLQVINGTLSLGTLVALAAYVTRLYGPLTALSNAHVDLLTAMVSFERVFEVLDAPLPLVDKPGADDSSSTTSTSRIPTRSSCRRSSSTRPSGSPARCASTARPGPRWTATASTGTAMAATARPPAARSCTACPRSSSRASSWRWSDRRAAARPRCRCSSPASTT